MANKPTKPNFPLGLESQDQSVFQEGILNNGVVEHGPDAVMTVPETPDASGVPSAVRYNEDDDQFEGFYNEGGWLPLGGGNGGRWEALPHASSSLLQAGRAYLVDNTDGVSTVLFPSPKRVGDSVTVCDLYGKFSTYPLTVDGNGKSIYGSADSMTISTDNVSATFTWTGEARGWVITSGVGLGQGRVYSREIYSQILSATTPSITLSTQPSIVDVYVDGKRLKESLYTLDGYEVKFDPVLASGSDVQIIQYIPIQLGAGGGGSGGTVITWEYNGGSAIGGETQIVLDVVVDSVSEIYIRGSRQQIGRGFTFDPATSTITLADELDAGDDVVVVINGDPTVYNQIDRTPWEVARANNVSNAEVILSTDKQTVLDGKTVLYDVVTQTSWAIPGGIPPGSKIVSVSLGVLSVTTGLSYDLIKIFKRGLVPYYSVYFDDNSTLASYIEFKTPESFGAVGNGIHDDSLALQTALNWLTQKAYRKLVFNPGKVYYHTVPLTATFSAASSIGCSLIMEGVLYPSSDVGDALTISEAMYCEFVLKVKGDGYNVSTIPDYSQADPVGCQQAFVINSCRGCKVDVFGYSYGGRVIRTKGTGNTKMSFIELSIKTGEGSCGQAAYLQATSDAYGRITHAQTQWDYFGIVLDKLTDVTISYWEYGNKNSSTPAFLINDCGSLDGSNITGGSTWDSDTSTTLKIVGGQGIHFSRLQVGEAYNGLIIEGSGTVDDKPTVTIDYILSYKTNVSVTLNNTTGVNIKSGLCDNTYHGVVYQGNIYNCKVNLDGRNNFTDMHYAPVGSVIDSLDIGGGLYSELATHFISMLNAVVKQLGVYNTNVVTLGRYLFLPQDNNCVVIGGKWTGSTQTSPIDYRPKHISNVFGVNTKLVTAGTVFLSGTSQGATKTINHGLWATPYEVTITPYNVNSGSTFSLGNIVIKSLSSSQIVLMYTGSSPLTGDMYLLVNISCENRVS